jgi:hypothetical protein
MQIADELGDASLQSAARDSRGVASFRAGDFEAAYELESSRFELRDELGDPDLVHDLYLSTIPTAAAVAQLDEARRLAHELLEVVADLTPHHRLHGAANLVEQEELKGAWDAVIALEDATVSAVEENRDTPCVRNARSLLLCAVARENAGDADRAAELEARADELETEGHGISIVTPRARLALARGRLDVLELLLADQDWLTGQTWFALPGAAARLDALAVIGDAKDVEEATRVFAAPYVEPFALRALGIVRHDEALLRKAGERFAVLGLRWHSDQTPVLMKLRASAA